MKVEGRVPTLGTTPHVCATAAHHQKLDALNGARIAGRSLAAVRRAALALKGGGVGYYPRAGFVHMDVGPVRQW